MAGALRCGEREGDLEKKEELAARILLAELGAALPARRSAVDFARHFIGEKDLDLRRAVQELRGEEARLELARRQVEENLPLLGRTAVREAMALEDEAQRLEGWLSGRSPESAPARLTAALLWEARYGEGRTRASLSARRRREVLPGFEDALELAPENELLFVALRRFSALLHAGGPWSRADLDWLRLRARTLPNRFRLHAADLRGAAEAGAGTPLPPELVEARRPFVEFGYDPIPALAWAVAGFKVGEAIAWGAAGLPWAAQALAWKSWGHSVGDAAAWAAQDFLPDEAAAFVACGATDPSTARRLRSSLGGVENLLAWHRAGFLGAEVLYWRAEGVHEAAEAQRRRQIASKPEFAVRTPPSAEEPGVVSASTSEEELTPPPVPKGLVGADSRGALVSSSSNPEPGRPSRRKSVELPDAWVAEGGAWIAWGLPAPKGGARAGATVLCRGLDGFAADILRDSEVVALEAVPSELSLEIESGWQGELDAFRDAAGRARGPGVWLLAALAPLQARLYWGLLFKRPVSPWGQTIDFDAAETWRQRWERRVQEYGEIGAPCPCEVTRTPVGGWCIEVPGSRRLRKAGSLEPLEATRVELAWVEAVRRFCLVMGLERLEGGWKLVAEKA